MGAPPNDPPTAGTPETGRLKTRPATARDRSGIWHILQPIIRAGETYTLERNMNEEQALDYWFSQSHQVFVAVCGIKISGTFYLRPNQGGGGAHVANAGFAVDPAFRRRGIARAMAIHALEQAERAGFTAMQFNFVIASNMGAIKLWHQLGFATVGRLPGAFDHPRLGLVDALVMYKTLAKSHSNATQSAT